MTVRIEAGDCRDVLKTLADCSVDSIVTDPPYSLVSIVKRFGKPGSAEAKVGVYNRAARGFMGKEWDTGETAFDPVFWADALRVLKPGGHVVAFGGTRTYHRLACAIEDAGFEIRDMVAWLYGSGFPKSHNVGKAIDRAAGAEREVIGTREYAGGHVQRSSPDKLAPPIGTFIRTQDDRLETAPATELAAAWEGWGTALKPALEPICLARKPLSGTVAANVLEHGAGAINIDACRVGLPDGEEKSGGFGNGKIGMCVTGDGKGRAAGVEWKSKTDGRWPANVVHDGSEEVVSAFPGKAGAFAPVRGTEPSSKTKAIFGQIDRRAENAFHGDTGSAARFFYSAKADAADRLESKHPTVKPVDLMRWLIRLVTPPGGTVLDPFAGSGTTAMAAMAEGFDAIVVEREAQYLADIRRRVAHVSGEDTPLFGKAAE